MVLFNFDLRMFLLCLDPKILHFKVNDFVLKIFFVVFHLRDTTILINLLI